MGLASFGASRRTSGGTAPIAGGTGSRFKPVGVKGLSAGIGCENSKM